MTNILTMIGYILFCGIVVVGVFTLLILSVVVRVAFDEWKYRNRKQ